MRRTNTKDHMIKLKYTTIIILLAAMPAIIGDCLREVPDNPERSDHELSFLKNYLLMPSEVIDAYQSITADEGYENE